MHQNSFFNILSFTDVESIGLFAINYIEEVHGLKGGASSPEASGELGSIFSTI
jgi:hypothetical protein